MTFWKGVYVAAAHCIAVWMSAERFSLDDIDACQAHGPTSFFGKKRDLTLYQINERKYSHIDQ